MTTENNKLIAEFMGEKLPYKNEQNKWEFDVQGAGKISSTNIEDLFRFMGYNYHNDWNYLMLVVEKIESIKGTQIFINGISCEIMFKGKTISKHFNTKIEAVYNACVTFIEWYNKQTAGKK